MDRSWCPTENSLSGQGGEGHVWAWVVGNEILVFRMCAGWGWLVFGFLCVSVAFAFDVLVWTVSCFEALKDKYKNNIHWGNAKKLGNAWKMYVYVQ